MEKKIRRLRIRRIVPVVLVVILILTLIAFWFCTPWVKEKKATYKIVLPQGIPSCKERLTEWLSGYPTSPNTKESMQRAFKLKLVCFDCALKAPKGGFGFSYVGIGLDERGKAHLFSQDFSWFRPYAIKSYQTEGEYLHLVLYFDLLLCSFSLLIVFGVCMFVLMFLTSFFDKEWAIEYLKKKETIAHPSPEKPEVGGEFLEAEKETAQPSEPEFAGLSRAQRKKRRRKEREETAQKVMKSKE